MTQLPSYFELLDLSNNQLSGMCVCMWMLQLRSVNCCVCLTRKYWPDSTSIIPVVSFLKQQPTEWCVCGCGYVHVGWAKWKYCIFWQGLLIWLNSHYLCCIFLYKSTNWVVCVCVLFSCVDFQSQSVHTVCMYNKELLIWHNFHHPSFTWAYITINWVVSVCVCGCGYVDVCVCKMEILCILTGTNDLTQLPSYLKVLDLGDNQLIGMCVDVDVATTKCDFLTCGCGCVCSQRNS